MKGIFDDADVDGGGPGGFGGGSHSTRDADDSRRLTRIAVKRTSGGRTRAGITKASCTVR